MWREASLWFLAASLLLLLPRQWYSAGPALVISLLLEWRHQRQAQRV